MPAFWLWLLVLVAVVNPFRTALGVPRAGRSQREVGEIALLGGIVAGVGALLVAALGGPLLDALDVSGPAIRLAAGIVAGVTGLLALLRPPPPAEPSLAGRAAALVPVAVPLVATPGLLFAAMSAHEDRGYPVLVVALVVAVALLTLVAATLPAPAPAGAAPAAEAAVEAAEAAEARAEVGVLAEGSVATVEAPAPATAPTITHRLVAWAGRLTGAALVAACVALVIDAVLAV